MAVSGATVPRPAGRLKQPLRWSLWVVAILSIVPAGGMLLVAATPTVGEWAAANGSAGPLELSGGQLYAVVVRVMVPTQDGIDYPVSVELLAATDGRTVWRGSGHFDGTGFAGYDSQTVGEFRTDAGGPFMLAWTLDGRVLSPDATVRIEERLVPRAWALGLVLSQTLLLPAIVITEHRWKRLAERSSAVPRIVE